MQKATVVEIKDGVLEAAYASYNEWGQWVVETWGDKEFAMLARIAKGDLKKAIMLAKKYVNISLGL